jgi:hypothetical protein
MRDRELWVIEGLWFGSDTTGYVIPSGITYPLYAPSPDQPSLFVVRATHEQPAVSVDMHGTYHPLVCKQIWAETTDVFFETTSWVFGTCMYPRKLANSQQACVGRIQNLRIECMDATSLVDFCENWKDALSPTVLGNFTGLRSITLDLYLDNFDGLNERLDVWNDSVWVDARLPDIIRALRQCGVREVVVTNDMEGMEEEWVPDLKPWAKAVREAVLSREPLV